MSTLQEDKPDSLADGLKSLLISKYKHLFHHLIHKIDKKLRQIERRKEALKNRVRRDRMLPPFFPPPPPPFALLPFGPHPFFHPFFRHHNSFHMFRPHPHFKILKKVETFNNFDTKDGSHGFIDVTNEFPGDDGTVVIQHTHKDFNSPKKTEEEKPLEIPTESKKIPIVENKAKEEASPEKVDFPFNLFDGFNFNDEKDQKKEEEKSLIVPKGLPVQEQTETEEQEHNVDEPQGSEDVKLVDEKPQVFGPFIIPLRDIDESKPFNPIPTLISSILKKFADNPNLHIKKIFIKKLDDPEPERKLKGTEEEVHELMNQVLQNGQGRELLDFLKNEVKKGVQN